MARKKEDLTGQNFGRWTVLYEAEPRTDKLGHSIRVWHCKCNCENHTEKDIIGKSLKQGTSQSCGCLQKERAIKAMTDAIKKTNKYILKGDYCEVYDNMNQCFIIDKNDIDLCKEHYWYVDKKTKYVHTHIWNSEKQKDHKLSLQTYLTNSKYVTHINNDAQDNRRCNLQLPANKF